MLMDLTKQGACQRRQAPRGERWRLSADYGCCAADMARLCESFSAMAATEPIFNVPRSVAGVGGAF